MRGPWRRRGGHLPRPCYASPWRACALHLEEADSSGFKLNTSTCRFESCPPHSLRLGGGGGKADAPDTRCRRHHVQPNPPKLMHCRGDLLDLELALPKAGVRFPLSPFFPVGSWSSSRTSVLRFTGSIQRRRSRTSRSSGPGAGYRVGATPQSLNRKRKTAPAISRRSTSRSLARLRARFTALRRVSMRSSSASFFGCGMAPER